MDGNSGAPVAEIRAHRKEDDGTRVHVERRSFDAPGGVTNDLEHSVRVARETSTARETKKKDREKRKKIKRTQKNKTREEKRKREKHLGKTAR